ncbi:phage tail length tape measure family protein [Burkholderia multivorans]|nr:phage tail length tape measure family protein [Burkholderia multivorans]
MALGSLVLELQGNVARTQEDMGRLQQIVESAMRRMDAAASRTSDNIQGIATAGRAIQRVKGAEDAAASIEKIGHSSVGARREVLVLAHELATGNFKRAAGSFMVLGERIDIMSKLMSPAGIAVAALAGAVIGFAAATVEGAKESAAFARSIQLTANYAGQTEASYNQLARNVQSATGVTISESREIAQGLIASGRISQGALQSVAMAATRLAAVSGDSADKIVGQFTTMSNGVLRWALEANKQYHFVDGALYDHIKALELSGHEEQAMIAASQALYDRLGHDAPENLGYIERAWRGVTNAISAAWDGLKSFGRTETAAEQAASLSAQMAQMRQPGGVRLGQRAPSFADSHPETYQDLARRLAAAAYLARQQQERADDQAYQAETAKKVVDAKERWDQLTEAHKVGTERMKEALDEAARVGHDAGASHADIAAMQERIRKEYAHGGSGAGLDRANLDAQTQPVQEQISAQLRLLENGQKQRELLYRDDQISQQAYYAQSKAAIEAYNVQIRTLYGEEIAIVENAARRAADARTRVTLTTRANALRNDQQQALLQSSERLAELTEKQTDDTRKYHDEVVKLNAELGKLDRDPGRTAGADFDREHGHLQRQATLSGDTDTLATLAQARNAAVAQAQMNTLKQQAEQITQRLTLAEQELAVQEQTGARNALQVMSQEDQLRQQAAQQLAAIQQQMQAIAATSGIPQLVLQSQQFGLQVDQLRASSDVLGQTLSKTFSQSVSSALDGIVTRTKTVKSAFFDMVTSLEQSITKLITNSIVDQLFGNLFNGGGTTGTGSGGAGLLGSLIGWALGGSSFMANNTGLATNVANLMPGDSLDNLMSVTNDFGTAPGLANGGPASPGSLYEVNERGPELLTVANRTYLMMGSEGGRVTPTGTASSGSRPTFNMAFNLPEATSRQTATQQAAAIMRHATIAMKRNS